MENNFPQKSVSGKSTYDASITTQNCTGCRGKIMFMSMQLQWANLPSSKQKNLRFGGFLFCFVFLPSA